MSRRAGVLAAAMVMVALGRTAADAQTSLQIPLQFDFLNPGAKSLALGGAFAGVADDATAVFANPAGLTQLVKSEVSFELRGTHVRTEFLQRGRLSGTVSNQLTDTIQGPVFGETTSDHLGPGFISAVYAHPSHRWVIAGYRHELVRIDQSFFSEGVFQKAPEEFTSRRDSPQESVREMSMTGYGAGGAYKPRRDLTIGGGLGVYRFNMDSVFRRFDTVGFLGPPNLAVELQRTTQTGDDTALAPSVGVLIEHGAVRVGGMYRHGPTFDFVIGNGIDPDVRGRFRVPDTLAAGVSGRIGGSMLATAEVTRVTYSRVRNDFVTDQAIGVGRQASFDLDNAVELHAGFQYLAASVPLTPRFRGGVWYDPDHSVHFTPSPQSVTASDRLLDERLAIALSTGKDQIHGTGGIGLTLHSRLEINAGFDLASTRKLFSASAILR